MVTIEPAAFRAHVDRFLDLALLGLQAADTHETRPDDSLRVGLKPLPELLGNSGSPVSCPFCSVALARGPNARLCLACGKALGPLPQGTAGCWEGSAAERLFVDSLGLQQDKQRNSSSGSSGRPLVAPADAVLPAGGVAEQGPSPYAQRARGSTNEDAAAGGTLLADEGSLLGGLATAPRGGLLGQQQQQQNNGSVAASPARVHMFASASPSSSPVHDMMSGGAIDYQGDRLGLGGGGGGDGKEDFFSQLSGLSALPLSRPDTIPSDLDPSFKQVLQALPDLSFMLSNHLVVPPGHRATPASAAPDAAVDPSRAAVLGQAPSPSALAALSPVTSSRGASKEVAAGAAIPAAPAAVVATGQPERTNFVGSSNSVGSKQQDLGGDDDDDDDWDAKDEWGDFTS